MNFLKIRLDRKLTNTCFPCRHISPSMLHLLEPFRQASLFESTALLGFLEQAEYTISDLEEEPFATLSPKRKVKVINEYHPDLNVSIQTIAIETNHFCHQNAKKKVFMHCSKYDA